MFEFIGNLFNDAALAIDMAGAKTMSDEDMTRYAKYYRQKEFTAEDKATINSIKKLGFGNGRELERIYRDANNIAPLVTEGWTDEQIEEETHYDSERLKKARALLEMYKMANAAGIVTPIGDPVQQDSDQSDDSSSGAAKQSDTKTAQPKKSNQRRGSANKNVGDLATKPFDVIAQPQQ